MSRWSWLLSVVVVLGCSDPNETPPDGATAADAPARPDAPTGPLSADAGSDSTLLSMQGVYGDFASRTLPLDAIAFDVKYPLWSDGATKRRWLILPPGSAPIDNTDPEHWKFPPGTRFVKEFTRDGVLVETRILERIGPGDADYSLRTYVWNAAQTEAVLDTDGALDVNGTGHDAPSASQCMSCHNGEPGKVLGFSAVQLRSQMIAQLSAAGRLKIPVPATTTFGPTGDPTAVAALGYLHGNCGHCHNPNGLAGAINNQTLRLDAAAKPVDQEPGWLTTVNVTVTGNGLGATKRIDPMQPTNSAVIKRMSVRGTGQMPLIATKLVDPDGVATVTAWDNSL